MCDDDNGRKENDKPEEGENLQSSSQYVLMYYYFEKYCETERGILVIDR